jgi:hypothetical protein
MARLRKTVAVIKRTSPSATLRASEIAVAFCRFLSSFFLNMKLTLAFKGMIKIKGTFSLSFPRPD